MSLINKGFNLRAAHKACGENMKVLQRKLAESLDAEAMKAQNMKPIAMTDISLKEMWDFCEEVDVTQFPILTGTLVEKRVVDAFDNVETIGQDLVTEFPSKLQVSKIPGAEITMTMSDIEPGERYKHDADIQESYVQVEGKKRGDILDITEEAVMFDQVGLVMREAEKFGRKAALDRERKILYTIQDATVGGVNYYAWYPSGARAAIYSGSVAAGPHLYSNVMDDMLQHWTDLDNAMRLFTAMRDANGDPIIVNPNTLLVPKALEVTAMRLMNNAMLPAARVGTTGVTDNPMEANPFARRFAVKSSAYLDIVSQYRWYLGDFKNQFVEKVVYPLQVLVRRDRMNDASWERDIMASYKVRYYTQPGAVDYRYVVRGNGTYGQPNAVGSYVASYDYAPIP
jgi:hypothetical protein